MSEERYSYSDDIESVVDMKDSTDGLGIELTTSDVVLRLNQLEVELDNTVELSEAKNEELNRLTAENEALREYALGLMANTYHGMGKEERKLILESELIALLTGEKAGKD